MQHSSIKAGRPEGTQALHHTGHGKRCFQCCQLQVCLLTLLVNTILDSLDGTWHQAVVGHQHLPTAASQGL